MTSSCADLDPFFDGELPKEAVAEFREHLAGCARCQAALRGRMQEKAVIGEAPARAAQHRAAEAGPVHRARRRTIIYLAPVLAAAAGVAIWLGAARGREPAMPLEATLAIEHRGVATRGSVAHVGDMLQSTVRGEKHRAIWVYLGTREVVIACPGRAECTSKDDSLELELGVPVPGQYSIITIGSAQPIMAPHGPLDRMLSSIAASGAHFEIRRIDVN